MCNLIMLHSLKDAIRRKHNLDNATTVRRKAIWESD